MAKKKDKPQIINNIGEINLEIDYDKLAESIVEAQSIADKQRTRNSFVSDSFVFLISLFFRVVSILGITVCILGFITIVKNAINTVTMASAYDVVVNMFASVIVGFALIMFGAYCIIMWKAAKEIEQEKDKNFIVAVFSGIVSFVALVVALLALFKVVG